MGILADFFIAPPGYAFDCGALAPGNGTILSDGFERAQYKNFTPLALEMLWAILRQEKWDAKRHRLEDVCHAENGESWLLRFPDELVHWISTADETTINHAANIWAGNKEVPGNPEELKPVLRDLKMLATQAQNRGRKLYLFGSL